MAVGTTIFIILALIILHSSAQQLQCNDDDYAPSGSDVPVCFMLSNELENALISSLNLYRLRRTFFPNDDIEPIVVAVTYEIQFDAISVNNVCPGVRESNRIDFPNTTKRHIWTSSRVFSRFHPKVIDWMLPTLLYLIYPVSNTYFNTTSNSEIVLILDVPSLSCIPSSDQLNAVLEDLTTMLKAYADDQGLITRRRRANKGYIVHGRAFALAYVAFLIPIFFLEIAVTSVYARVIVTKSVQGHLKEVFDQQEPNYQLFLAAYITTALANLLFLLFEIIGFIAWIIKSSDGDVNTDAVITIIFKFCIFLVMVFGALPIIVAWYIIKKLPVTPKKDKTLLDLDFFKHEYTPEGLRNTVPIASCLSGCIMYPCIDKDKRIIFFIVWNFLCFALISVTWCLVPLLMIVFITPIQALAIVLFFSSIFLLFTVSIAVGLRAIKRGHNQTSSETSNNDSEEVTPKCTKSCKICGKGRTFTGNKILNTIATVTVCFIIFVLFSFYLYLVRIGINTEGILGIAALFAPGALTAAVVWFSRRFLKKADTDSETNSPTVLGSQPQPDSPPHITTVSRNVCDSEDSSLV